jgi:hypothetical protein
MSNGSIESGEPWAQLYVRFFCLQRLVSLTKYARDSRYLRQFCFFGLAVTVWRGWISSAAIALHNEIAASVRSPNLTVSVSVICLSRIVYLSILALTMGNLIILEPPYGWAVSMHDSVDSFFTQLQLCSGGHLLAHQRELVRGIISSFSAGAHLSIHIQSQLC